MPRPHTGSRIPQTDVMALLRWTRDDQRRVVGVDVARCLALLGMMATHMLPRSEQGQITWHQALAGGRASALFAVLAGVSLALVSGRSEPLTGRERLAASAAITVRAVLIGAVGLWLGGLGTGIAVILTYYAGLFVLGLPFLGLRAGQLAALAAAWAIGMPVIGQVLRPALPARGSESPTLAALSDPWQLLTELTLTGYYPAMPWLAYLFAGLAIGRSDLVRARAGALLLGGGAALAAAATVVSDALVGLAEAQTALRATLDPPGVVGAHELDRELAQGLHGTTPTGSWWWLAVHAPHSSTPFDLAQTIGSAMAVLGLCLLVTRAAPRAFAIVFGAGAMTLTLYSTHVAILTPNTWPHLERPSDYGQQVALVLGAGAVFALLRSRGPLEQLVARASRAAALVVRQMGRGGSRSRGRGRNQSR